MSLELPHLVAFVQPAQIFVPGFSPAELGNTPGSGPNSNTGQKATLSSQIIDFCTVVIPAGALKRSGCPNFRDLLDWIFSTGSDLAMGPILDRVWQFHPQSATLVNQTGVAGKMGFAEDGKVCISLTGQGCQHVGDWSLARRRLVELGAWLTRLDIAVDDLLGDTFDVDYFRQAWERHEFTSNGRPPLAQFVDDCSTGKGCTFYVGQKGHKQLCIYDKGKQLGDPDSKHTRCELRLYAKRTDLPLDALTSPGKYFAGAYPLLAYLLIGEAERLQVRETMVNASATAMLRFMRTQAGTALHLVLDALGDKTAEEILDFYRKHIARPGCPGRFKSYIGDRTQLLRTQLEALNNETDNLL